MTELSFNCVLRCRAIDLSKKRPVSTHKINAEWRLTCLWSYFDQMNMQPCRPEFLEIRRNSTAMEIIVSGTLKLFNLKRGEECVLQRKFKLLFEADSSTSLIGLEFSDNEPYNPYNKPRRIAFNYHPYDNCDGDYSISGTLTIPANLTHEKYAKWDQFECLQELSNDFKLLLDPKKTYFSDVTLKCGTDSFPAHKNILSARSPVFAAMFSTEMKETQENKVDIGDISSQVLKTMLTYIYTGKTGELSVQSSGELLFAADMYQLQDLKRVCGEYLKSSLSIENALKTLVLGDLHDEDLKVFAIDFICDSCEEFEILEKTVEWKDLREKTPSLAMDVLTSLVKSKQKVADKTKKIKETTKSRLKTSLQYDWHIQP